MSSRDIQSLNPDARLLAQQLMQSAEDEGFDLLIYCTSRSLVEQAKLYRNGRSLSEIQAKADELNSKYQRPDLGALLMEVGPQMGKNIVTWAGPGQSIHNYDGALDAVPMRGGKPVWGTSDNADLSLWLQYGDLAEWSGFEWAGRWPIHKREFPHVQQPGLNWRDLIGIGSVTHD